jgi:hypothetical protein
MSIEKVLRSFGDDQANRLADAWYDHERRQDERHNALRLDIDKAVSRSNLSVTLAGITLAGLLAATLYVGPELGGLKERVGSLKESVDEIKRRADQISVQLDAQAKIIKAIDERVQRMDRAAIGDPTGGTSRAQNEHSGQ